MSDTYTHLTLSDLIEIERMLSVSATVSAIADHIGFTRQSVVREIMRNRTDEDRVKSYGRHWNGCVHQRRCALKHVCGFEECNKRCASCRSVNCAPNCKQFCANGCPALLRPPYVCNGCPEYKSCAYPRLAYHAALVQGRADELLISARKGADFTEDEAALILATAKPMLDNGVSPAVIWAKHADKMPCSERSFYRYVKDGDIDGIVTLDLPSAAGYKQRKQQKTPSRTNISKEALEGRTYADFLLLADTVRANAAEMDCVMGKVTDESCLLTLFFRKWAFQPCFLLPQHTAWNVVWSSLTSRAYWALRSQTRFWPIAAASSRMSRA
jgi:IS30 family transposase